MDPFTNKLKLAEEQAKAVLPCTSILIDEPGKAIDIQLDPKCSTISEWIPGEGADICLYWTREKPRRLVGCHLPLIHSDVKLTQHKED